MLYWQSAGIFNKSILPNGFSGIFISGYSAVGKNCVIFHQVTIGSNTLIGSKNIGAPIF